MSSQGPDRDEDEVVVGRLERAENGAEYYVRRGIQAAGQVVSALAPHTNTEKAIFWGVTAMAAVPAMYAATGLTAIGYVAVAAAGMAQAVLPVAAFEGLKAGANVLSDKYNWANKGMDFVERITDRDYHPEEEATHAPVPAWRTWAAKLPLVGKHVDVEPVEYADEDEDLDTDVQPQAWYQKLGAKIPVVRGYVAAPKALEAEETEEDMVDSLGHDQDEDNSNSTTAPSFLHRATRGYLGRGENPVQYDHEVFAEPKGRNVGGYNLRARKEAEKAAEAATDAPRRSLRNNKK